MRLLRCQVSQLSVFVLGRWRVVHATAVFGSLASQIVQRTKKTSKPFCFEMNGMLYLTPK